MYISGAKFEEHCSNISRDIFDSVFYCSSARIYDVITFLICIIKNVNISRTKKDIRKKIFEKRYSKKVNAILLYFEKLFK